MGCCSDCGNSISPGSRCGCQTLVTGPAGADGVNGLSAYEIWLGEGNVGTEQDFLDSLVGPQGPAGSNGTTLPKENFYAEYTTEIEVSSGLPDPTIYHFPTGYGVLTYTNSSGGAKDYYVHGAYDCLVKPDNSNSLYNSVHGALVKTVLAVDNVEYENKQDYNVYANLMNGTNIGDFVDRSAGTDNVYDDMSNKVEFRFQGVDVPYNVSMFKKVTLNDGESISLKFKTVEPGVASTLKQAQLFVVEID